MSQFWTWSSWDLDWQTWGWILWIGFFLVWETVTGFTSKEQLTHHLRPLILSAPVVWFLVFGLWMWIGIHMLMPTFEAWLLDYAS